MNMWKISFVVLCLLVASILAAQQPSGIVVIQGATLITGTGSPAIRNSAIVIDGGRIRDIGPRNEVRVPGNAQTVDARGKWVIPGLIDAHVHFSQSGGIYTRPDVVDLPFKAPTEKAKRDVQRGGIDHPQAVHPARRGGARRHWRWPLGGRWVRTGRRLHQVPHRRFSQSYADPGGAPLWTDVPG